MRWAVLALVCAVVAAALPAAAHAQAANGQLAVVLGDRIATVNADGTGLRSLYAPRMGAIKSPAWAPDGNKLAFILEGKLVVLDVATRKADLLTNPPAGEYDADPAWAADGGSVGFRRVSGATQHRRRVALSGLDAPLATMVPAPAAFAYAPGLRTYAYTVGSELYVSRLEDFPLVSGAAGALAWSHDGMALAYVESGPVYEPGLRVLTDVLTTPMNTRVTALAAESPRWAPDGRALAFVHQGAVHTVALARDATPVAVPGATGAVAVDWQPCSAATTVGCRSVLAPTCTATAVQVTTQADVPVELPPAPCSDPAGLPLRVEIDRPGEHGTVTGTVYTPHAGFTGQDTLTYRVSNGSAQSDPVRVTVFVVPRTVAAGPQPAAVAPAAAAAPFLGLRARPVLSRGRSTLARLSCDRACTFTVRLEGTLRAKQKPIKGKTVKRTLAARKVLALRLRLPAKPKGKLKTVFITGTVRGANRAARPVKLAVSVPR